MRNSYKRSQNKVLLLQKHKYIIKFILSYLILLLITPKIMFSFEFISNFGVVPPSSGQLCIMILNFENVGCCYEPLVSKYSRCPSLNLGLKKAKDGNLITSKVSSFIAQIHFLKNTAFF